MNVAFGLTRKPGQSERISCARMHAEMISNLSGEKLICGSPNQI